MLVPRSDYMDADTTSDGYVAQLYQQPSIRLAANKGGMQ